MPVRISWFNDEKTIIRYDFEGRWTWDDFYPVYEEALRLEKAQPHRVDVIMDFRRNQTIPPNILTHLRGITDRQPDNIGISVFVTDNRFFQVMYNVADKVIPNIRRYFAIAATMDDARELIEKDRPDTPPNPS